MKDFGKILREAQKLQQEMARVQQELSNTRVEGTAGGGAVTIVLTGTQEPVEVRILPEVLESADASLLEDMVLTAIKNAVDKSRELMQNEMEKISGGLGLPGMPGGLF